jgi:hypothetical protein
MSVTSHILEAEFQYYKKSNFHKFIRFFNTTVLMFVITDTSPSLQEDMYQVGQEVTTHNVHISPDADKTVFHTNSGENEGITWQPKQVDMEVSNALQKAFNSGIPSRSTKNSSDGRENRIQNCEYL